MAMKGYSIFPRSPLFGASPSDGFTVISKTLVVLYSHLHHYSVSQRHNIKDRRMKKGSRKEDARRLL